MGEPFEKIAGLDRLIHDPSRLAILTALKSTAGANFLYLHRLTRMSKGNLSNHLIKLEEAGLVSIEKKFVGKKGVTTAGLTEQGRTTIEAHWAELERLKAETERWSEPELEEPMRGLTGEVYGGATS